jgi:hypothetical protein
MPDFSSDPDPERIFGCWVPIDPCEWRIIEAVASFRVERVEGKKLAGKGHGEPGTSLEHRDLPGAAAELVLAKITGQYWAGSMDAWSAGGDVGALEVRGTFHLDGHLICYAADDNAKELYLVVIDKENSRGKLVGHRAARHSKQDCFLKAPAELRPGSQAQYWIPQSELVADC